LVLYDHFEEESDKAYANLLKSVNLENITIENPSESSGNSLRVDKTLKRLTTEEVQYIIRLLEQSERDSSSIYACFITDKEYDSSDLKSGRLLYSLNSLVSYT
jgi:hypothetical protein